MDKANPTSSMHSSVLDSTRLGETPVSLDPTVLPEELINGTLWNPKGSTAQSSTRAQRRSMNQLILGGQESPLLQKNAPDASKPSPSSYGLTSAWTASTPTPSAIPSSLAGWTPTFVSLVARVREELENHVSKLLTLNPSRRDAVVLRLCYLAGLPLQSDSQGSLPSWISIPRSRQQAQALQLYFEEVARIFLGQALLLKAWSDRGIRPWKEDDLGKLNWSLSSALKPHVPLDRENWQVTRPNLYSWYNPSAPLQKEIWAALEPLRFTDEGPALISSLLRFGYQQPPHSLSGYDDRFFSALWEQMPSFGFSVSRDEDPLRRKKSAFSPTLRDGGMVKTGPVDLSWIGVENDSFSLLQAELIQLWWGPSTPPLWAVGNGLEVHSRDQLSLSLNSPKPSLLSRIAEREACEISWVLEELPITSHSRNLQGQLLRKQLENLPYFKKLKSQETTLGDLQACVALTKLRPGGLLWWARERPLSSQDGQPVLNFLLDRARLLCEWDLSEITHSLPVTKPMFSRYLYVFAREPELSARVAHRPMRIRVQGQIRSHVELPGLLGEALQSFHRGTSQSRGSWQFHCYASPTSQKEWAERWPDPAAQEDLETLETLKQNSLPLANLGTIRPTPAGDPQQQNTWTVHPSLKGFWIQVEQTKEDRRLIATELPKQGERAKGAGYLVLVSNEAIIAPLCSYLESESVKKWLDFHAERKSDRWVLGEQTVRYLPIPQMLLFALGINAGTEEPSGQGFATPLPGEWERLASDILYSPGNVLQKIHTLKNDAMGSRIRSHFFVRASRALAQLKVSQGRLLSMVTDQGQIRWREILRVLPQGETTPISVHPLMRLSGSLPNHLPITRIDRVSLPMPGILFATESGFHLHAGTESSLLLDMILDQLEGVEHPTWHELVQFLLLPRNLEIAETTASDILQSCGEQMKRMEELSQLIGCCSRF